MDVGKVNGEILREAGLRQGTRIVFRKMNGVELGIRLGFREEEGRVVVPDCKKEVSKRSEQAFWKTRKLVMGVMGAFSDSLFFG